MDQPEQTITIEPQYEPADFWIRAGARFIDWIAMFGGLLVVMFVVAIVAMLTDQPRLVRAIEKDGGIDGWIFGALLQVGYHAVFEGFSGTTIGKRLTGLQVIGIDLAPVRFRQALYRSAAFLIDSLFFGLVAYRHMRESPERSRLGDEWADTRVVRRRSLPESLRTPRLTILGAGAATFGLVARLTLLQIAFNFFV
ncbi:MAG: RDD family protein [Thermoanaerobaculia bacterium]